MGCLDDIEAGHDPVDRVDLWPGHPRVGEERQAEVPRPRAVPGGVPVRLIAAVGRIPVMPVGDHRPSLVQVLGDAGQHVRVGQRPDPV